MKSKNIATIRFILGMHPTFANHDEMKLYLELYLTDPKFALIPVNQFFIKGRQCTNIKVVKIQVDGKNLDTVHNKIVGIHGPELLGKGNKW